MASLEPSGLPNLGNSCYMNMLLQIFLKIAEELDLPAEESIQQLAAQQLAAAQNEMDVKKCQISCEIALNLLSVLHAIRDGTLGARLKKILASFKSALLQHPNFTLTRGRGRNQQDALDAWEAVVSSLDNIGCDHLFGLEKIQVEEKFVCSTCGTTRFNDIYETFSLMVNLNGNKSVQSMLDAKLDNRFCEVCRDHCRELHPMQTVEHRLVGPRPKRLMICIERHRGRNAERLYRLEEEQLGLRRAVELTAVDHAEGEAIELTSYRFDFLGYQIGNFDSGHYSCVQKCGNRLWEVNDNNVYLATEWNEYDAGAQILAYTIADESQVNTKSKAPTVKRSSSKDGKDQTFHRPVNTRSVAPTAEDSSPEDGKDTTIVESSQSPSFKIHGIAVKKFKKESVVKLQVKRGKARMKWEKFSDLPSNDEKSAAAKWIVDNKKETFFVDRPEEMKEWQKFLQKAKYKKNYLKARSRLAGARGKGKTQGDSSDKERFGPFENGTSHRVLITRTKGTSKNGNFCLQDGLTSILLDLDFPFKAKRTRGGGDAAYDETRFEFRRPAGVGSDLLETEEFLKTIRGSKKYKGLKFLKLSRHYSDNFSLLLSLKEGHFLAVVSSEDDKGNKLFNHAFNIMTVEKDGKKFRMISDNTKGGHKVYYSPESISNPDDDDDDEDCGPKEDARAVFRKVYGVDDRVKYFHLTDVWAFFKEGNFPSSLQPYFYDEMLGLDEDEARNKKRARTQAGDKATTKKRRNNVRKVNQAVNKKRKALEQSERQRKTQRKRKASEQGEKQTKKPKKGTEEPMSFPSSPWSPQVLVSKLVNSGKKLYRGLFGGTESSSD